MPDQGLARAWQHQCTARAARARTLVG